MPERNKWEDAVEAAAEAMAREIGGRRAAGVLKRIGARLDREIPYPDRICAEPGCSKVLERRTRGDRCRRHVRLSPLALSLRARKAGATQRARYAIDPERRKRRTEVNRATADARLSWCPPELRPERRRLVQQFGSVEANRMIRDQIDLLAKRRERELAEGGCVK